MVWGLKQIMRGNSLDSFCSLFGQELGINRDGKIVSEIEMVDVD